MQVLTGEVTRLTAALEQAQREADAAGQARAEADDLSTQVGHGQLSAADSMPSGSCSSVQHTLTMAASCLLMSNCLGVPGSAVHISASI